MILLQTQGNPIMSFLPLIGIVLVFYFFFIRPQQKKQKTQSKFVEDLNKGDEVVTSSGIIGKINKIDENVVTLQIDQKTFIKVLKSSVSKEMTDSIRS
ncbi:MAG: preprotein translocase subunit YajC [Saprospiraceae bacterium]|nr:preprotein translocase subunit YajC [Saprospiraceae bacterium]